jgi:hypothetical protein
LVAKQNTMQLLLRLSSFLLFAARAFKENIKKQGITPELRENYDTVI